MNQLVGVTLDFNYFEMLMANTLDAFVRESSFDNVFDQNNNIKKDVVTRITHRVYEIYMRSQPRQPGNQ